MGEQLAIGKQRVPGSGPAANLSVDVSSLQ